MPVNCTLFSAGTVKVNAVTIKYHRSGGDKPPAVLSHGMTDSGLCWTRVAARLALDYDVIVYDARGHGESTAPDSGYGPDDYCADLHGLLLALDVTHARLLGHSMGAMTVAQLSARYPELVHAVVLEDPPIPPRWSAAPSAEELDYWHNHWENWRKDVVQQRNLSVDDLVLQCRSKSPGWHDSEILAWAQAKSRVCPRIFDTQHLFTTNWWQCLTHISCPVMLITGEIERGALITEPVASAIKAEWPRGSMLRLSGAGHNIHREQFELFIDAVLDFFKVTQI
jgi:N-formylmaleamate deformylase